MSELIATPYRGALDLIENIPLQTPYVVYIEPSGICKMNIYAEIRIKSLHARAAL